MIWIGYSDEGVGTFPDADGQLANSIGAIVCSDSTGKLLWSFNGDGQDQPWIIDCYAMSLSANTLWACCYTDFPIVRIENGTMRQWRNSITGARAIAVDDDHVVLAGGYDNEADRIALLRLDGDRATYLGKLTFPLLRNAKLIQGQSNTLHVVAQGNWTRIEVVEIRAALGL
jgi:hypothetical protein